MARDDQEWQDGEEGGVVLEKHLSHVESVELAKRACVLVQIGLLISANLSVMWGA